MENYRDYYKVNFGSLIMGLTRWIYVSLQVKWVLTGPIAGYGCGGFSLFS